MASCRNCWPSRNSPRMIFSRNFSATAEDSDCLGIGEPMPALEGAAISKIVYFILYSLQIECSWAAFNGVPQQISETQVSGPYREGYIVFGSGLHRSECRSSITTGERRSQETV